MLVTIKYMVVFIKTIMNEVNYLSPCHQEEADTYIVIHVMQARSASHTNASNRIVDSDSVLVIDVALSTI